MINRRSFAPFQSSAIRLAPRMGAFPGFDMPEFSMPDFSDLSLGPFAPPAPSAAPPAPPPAASPAPGFEVPIAPQWRSPVYVYPEDRNVPPPQEERVYETTPISTGIETKDLLIGGAVLVALVAILS